MFPKQKILIAEDVSATLKLVESVLSTIGHEVTTAADGQEAWEVFDRDPHRIVISDWRMPGMGGLDLCRRIRDRPDIPYTYFILLTVADPTKENYNLAHSAGVDDYLTKPLSMFALKTRLDVAQRIIEYTQTIRELKELLPICSYCKKIRGDDKYWEQIESYLHRTKGTDFSHGVCPECYEKILLPEVEKWRSK